MTPALQEAARAAADDILIVDDRSSRVSMLSAFGFQLADAVELTSAERRTVWLVPRSRGQQPRQSRAASSPRGRSATAGCSGSMGPPGSAPPPTCCGELPPVVAHGLSETCSEVRRSLEVHLYGHNRSQVPEGLRSTWLLTSLTPRTRSSATDHS